MDKKAFFRVYGALHLYGTFIAKQRKMSDVIKKDAKSLYETDQALIFMQPSDRWLGDPGMEHGWLEKIAGSEGPKEILNYDKLYVESFDSKTMVTPFVPLEPLKTAFRDGNNSKIVKDPRKSSEYAALGDGFSEEQLSNWEEYQSNLPQNTLMTFLRPTNNFSTPVTRIQQKMLKSEHCLGLNIMEFDHEALISRLKSERKDGGASGVFYKNLKCTLHRFGHVFVDPKDASKGAASTASSQAVFFEYLGIVSHHEFGLPRNVTEAERLGIRGKNVQVYHVDPSAFPTMENVPFLADSMHSAVAGEKMFSPPVSGSAPPSSRPDSAEKWLESVGGGDIKANAGNVASTANNYYDWDKSWPGIFFVLSYRTKDMESNESVKELENSDRLGEYEEREFQKTLNHQKQILDPSNALSRLPPIQKKYPFVRKLETQIYLTLSPYYHAEPPKAVVVKSGYLLAMVKNFLKGIWEYKIVAAPLVLGVPFLVSLYFNGQLGLIGEASKDVIGFVRQTLVPLYFAGMVGSLSMTGLKKGAVAFGIGQGVASVASPQVVIGLAVAMAIGKYAEMSKTGDGKGKKSKNKGLATFVSGLLEYAGKGVPYFISQMGKYAPLIRMSIMSVLTYLFCENFRDLLPKKPITAFFDAGKDTVTWISFPQKDKLLYVVLKKQEGLENALALKVDSMTLFCRVDGLPLHECHQAVEVSYERVLVEKMEKQRLKQAKKTKRALTSVGGRMENMTLQNTTKKNIFTETPIFEPAERNCNYTEREKEFFREPDDMSRVFESKTSKARTNVGGVFKTKKSSIVEERSNFDKETEEEEFITIPWKRAAFIVDAKKCGLQDSKELISENLKNVEKYEIENGLAKILENTYLAVPSERGTLLETNYPTLLHFAHAQKPLIRNPYESHDFSSEAAKIGPKSGSKREREEPEGDADSFKRAKRSSKDYANPEPFSGDVPYFKENIEELPVVQRPLQIRSVLNLNQATSRYYGNPPKENFSLDDFQNYWYDKTRMKDFSVVKEMGRFLASSSPLDLVTAKSGPSALKMKELSEKTFIWTALDAAKFGVPSEPKKPWSLRIDAFETFVFREGRTLGSDRTNLLNLIDESLLDESGKLYVSAVSKLYFFNLAVKKLIDSEEKKRTGSKEEYDAESLKVACKMNVFMLNYYMERVFVLFKAAFDKNATPMGGFDYWMRTWEDLIKTLPKYEIDDPESDEGNQKKKVDQTPILKTLLYRSLTKCFDVTCSAFDKVTGLIHSRALETLKVQGESGFSSATNLLVTDEQLMLLVCGSSLCVDFPTSLKKLVLSFNSANESRDEIKTNLDSECAFLISKTRSEWSSASPVVSFLIYRLKPYSRNFVDAINFNREDVKNVMRVLGLPGDLTDKKVSKILKEINLNTTRNRHLYDKVVGTRLFPKLLHRGSFTNENEFGILNFDRYACESVGIIFPRAQNVYHSPFVATKKSPEIVASTENRDLYLQFLRRFVNAHYGFELSGEGFERAKPIARSDFSFSEKCSFSDFVAACIFKTARHLKFEGITKTFSNTKYLRLLDDYLVETDERTKTATFRVPTMFEINAFKLSTKMQRLAYKRELSKSLGVGLFYEKRASDVKNMITTIKIEEQEEIVSEEPVADVRSDANVLSGGLSSVVRPLSYLSALFMISKKLKTEYWAAVDNQTGDYVPVSAQSKETFSKICDVYDVASDSLKKGCDILDADLAAFYAPSNLDAKDAEKSPVEEALETGDRAYYAAFSREVYKAVQEACLTVVCLKYLDDLVAFAESFTERPESYPRYGRALENFMEIYVYVTERLYPYLIPKIKSNARLPERTLENSESIRETWKGLSERKEGDHLLFLKRCKEDLLAVLQSF